MKVLLVNTLYTPNLVGGAERTVQFIAESLVEAGHGAVVVSATAQKGVQVHQVNGVQAYYVGLKNLFWPLKGAESPQPSKPLWALWHALDTYNLLMARRVAHIVNTERPELIHTNNLSCFSALIWQLVKQRGLPLVHTLHDYYLLCTRSNMFREEENCKRMCTKCRPYALPRKHLSSHVDSVVANSQFVLKRHLACGYFAASSKKTVIYDTSRVELDVPSLETHSSSIRFGYLGRLVPEKGIETLLKSVTQLPKGTWTLDVAGRGRAEYERYLHARCKGSAIRFLGYVRPEVFFSEVDILVVPSLWHEPMGKVIFEAYACGVPVIGSNRGGIPELIEEGCTGYLFEPSRPDDLTRRMLRFIGRRDMIAVMKAACRKKAESLQPEDTFKQYLQIYNDTLGCV